MASRPNVIVIMTDTQNRDMIGAYGLPQMGTPHLDRLCSEGVRFNRAYTTCPLCTPARGALFTGIHPQVNGATYNGVSPYSHIPHAGHLFRRHGYRAAYTGKWHLDGDYPYLGSGVPDPGFEPDWWYDGQNYRREVGEDTFRMCYNPKDLLKRAAQMPEDPSRYWAHRVADRAIDFLQHATGGQPFFLGVSFDEPHGPYGAPPSYYRGIDPDAFPVHPAWNNPGTGKPQMQQMAAAHHGRHSRDGLRDYLRMYYGCNRFVDSQIGRVLEAIRTYAGEDTIVVYTTDHGNCMADYGLWSKAFWMYERTTNIPLIISGPGYARGTATNALASHVDILPTLLAAAGLPTTDPVYAEQRWPTDCPPERMRDRHPAAERLHGVDLAPVLRDPAARVRDLAHISFLRFGNLPKGGHFGNVYPVRCAVGERHKLVLNLFDQDEFYDLERDPFELENRLHDPAGAAERDRLHTAILAHMDDITDPLRGHVWGQRPWHPVGRPFFMQPG